MIGRHAVTLWALTGALIGLSAPSLAHGAEESALTDDAMVLKEESGHRLLLPNDWPIERHDGVIEPISVSKYLSMKFGQVRAEFARMTQRLTALETRLAAVEMERTLLLRRLHALEERVAASELPAAQATAAEPSGAAAAPTSQP